VKAVSTETPMNRGRYSSYRVLLVEDNPVNQAVSKVMLEYFGCRTDVAANGQEALKALAVTPYDLVLMDCQMPVMDGYEATRVIRQQEAAGGCRRRNAPAPYPDYHPDGPCDGGRPGGVPEGGDGRLSEQAL
jgi:PleD family two-component response regulator